MIARESIGRYYVGWRSRVLLVAKDQIRLATMEEAAASDTIAKDMALTTDQKYYQDMTGAEAPKRRQKTEVPQVLIMPLLRDMPEAVRALEYSAAKEIPEDEVIPEERDEWDELLESAKVIKDEDQLARDQILARGTGALADALGFGSRGGPS